MGWWGLCVFGRVFNGIGCILGSWQTALGGGREFDNSGLQFPVRGVKKKERVSEWVIHCVGMPADDWCRVDTNAAIDWGSTVRLDVDVWCGHSMDGT